jgi:hypothetical protein
MKDSWDDNTKSKSTFPVGVLGLKIERYINSWEHIFIPTHQTNEHYQVLYVNIIEDGKILTSGFMTKELISNYIWGLA